MSSNSTFARISNFVGMMGSAISAANAVESHRAPAARDLKRLGIDPVQFNKIGRF
jgi:hypothetical protein